MEKKDERNRTQEEEKGVWKAPKHLLLHRVLQITVSAACLGVS
jgi:hypothetical protein